MIRTPITGIILAVLCLTAFFAAAEESTATTKSVDTVTTTPPIEGRAVWIARFHFKTPDDVRAIMANCSKYNFNEVYFQVRGNGTVFYKSEIEPWAWELTGEGPQNVGKDPGWDPLAVAVEEGHKLGLKVHAWINVYPGWRGEDWPPNNVPQLWNSHPEWFMRWKDGSVMQPWYMRNDQKVVWYSFINPAVPAVNKYLLNLFDEMAANYEIDGIHLDYVRYPHDLKGWDFSYDKVSLERFKDATGKLPEDAPDEWNDWRAAQVTALVRALKANLETSHPGVVLTTAVAGNYEHGRANMQYSRQWMKDGLVDAVVLMNYTPDTADYLKNIREAVAESKGTPIYSGMGPFRIMREENADEIFRAHVVGTRASGAAGTAQFSYTSLFDKNQNPLPFAKILLEEFYQHPVPSPLFK